MQKSRFSCGTSDLPELRPTSTASTYLQQNGAGDASTSYWSNNRSTLSSGFIFLSLWEHPEFKIIYFYLYEVSQAATTTGVDALRERDSRDPKQQSHHSRSFSPKGNAL